MTIETQRLILRKYTIDDAEAFLEFMSDEETNTFLPWLPLNTIADSKKFLEERFLLPYRYAVCLKSDNKPIGYVCVSDGESNDFGYCLTREFWNQGIITDNVQNVSIEFYR
jgi:Acetyltransferases, including N-acetylases of ribosomal proteins